MSEAYRPQSELPLTPEQQAVEALTSAAEEAFASQDPRPLSRLDMHSVRTPIPEDFVGDLSGVRGSDGGSKLTRIRHDDGRAVEYEYTKTGARNWTKTRWMEGGDTATESWHSEDRGSAEDGFLGSEEVVSDVAKLSSLAAALEREFPAASQEAPKQTKAQTLLGRLTLSGLRRGKR